MNNGFELTLMATSWGFDGTIDEFCNKAKKDGYDGIEVLWPLQKKAQEELFTALKKYGLEAYEDAARSVINLLTFLFVVSGFVYTFFAHPDSGIEGYVDALYFTVTTITTTIAEMITHSTAEAPRSASSDLARA